MADDSPCRRSSCNVAKSGACVLGNDPLESCPEYETGVIDLEFDEDVEEAEGTSPPPKPAKLLHRSDLLRRDDLWCMRKAVATTTISLVGDHKAGKTTLVAALYGSFCKGPFAGYSFKSSRTLTAFARRHHTALERSKRILPTTPRTSRHDGVGFFHLNVVGPAGERHLVIADRSGEDFRDARRNTELTANLWELPMADRVCFILDAGRIADHGTRAGYKREFKQQIWALLNNDALRPSAELEIVTTKLDRLAPRGERTPRLDELQEFEESVVAEFAAAGQAIGTRGICALPRSNFAVGVLGLENLLQSWLKAERAADVRPLPAISPARWIDRAVVT